MSYAPPPPPSGFQSPGYLPQFPYATEPDPRRKKFIIGCSVALVAASTLFVVGLLTLIFGAIKSTDAYKTGIRAMHDPRVEQKLGAPVKAGWFPGGSISTNGASGSADLRIPVKGSARSGAIYVVGRKSAGEWSYQKINLRVDGEQQTVDLLEPSGK